MNRVNFRLSGLKSWANFLFSSVDLDSLFCAWPMLFTNQSMMNFTGKSLSSSASFTQQKHGWKFRGLQLTFPRCRFESLATHVCVPVVADCASEWTAVHRPWTASWWTYLVERCPQLVNVLWPVRARPWSTACPSKELLGPCESDRRQSYLQVSRDMHEWGPCT